MAITHLIFVRHGESRHKLEALTGGWTDTSLTERGRSQIATAAKALRRRGFDDVVLYSSDLLRAFESAKIIGNEIGCEPKVLSVLREINNGDAADLTLEEAREIRFSEPAGRNLDWRPYENAETWREMARRMETAFDEMQVEDGQVAVIVGHANSGQALISSWLGLELNHPIAFHFDPGSITELRVNRWGEREIIQLNQVHYA